MVAAVLVAPERFELRELPVPQLGDEDGLLRVEACGLCGSDVEQFRGVLATTLGLPFPLVPGHEIVGIVEEAGAAATRHWGVRPGDRVAVEPPIRCGTCRGCHSGEPLPCTGRPRPLYGYGHLPLTEPPGIWGGLATHLYLHPDSVLHRVPDGLPADIAVLFQPLGGGISWTLRAGGVRAGDVVVVLGPGPRGLACALAAQRAGAAQVIVTGLAADRHRLDVAARLAADVTIDVGVQDAVARVRDLTGGSLADVVIDVTSGATGAVVDAIDMVRPGGTVVLAGLKGGRPVAGLVTDSIVNKGVTVRGAVGVDSSSYREALALIADDPERLGALVTHRFPLDAAERAVRTVAGEDPAAEAVGVVMVPSGPSPM